SIMVAGGVLAYLVMVPAIAYFGDGLAKPLAPAPENGKLIKDMSVGELRSNYIIYIGAGAVATGGIISMFQALPVIFGSVVAGLRDLTGGGAGARNGAMPRTERDLSMGIVVFGSLALVVAIGLAPSLGLDVIAKSDAGYTFNWFGVVAAALIVLLGFLFVTVSSRLTGEVGSSSNPISGMTVAALLITCLVFVFLGRTEKSAMLTALTVAAVVCVASSNGGTTSQDLKTGFLVGATPSKQQWAILIGALTSALVIGFTLLALNEAGSIYTKKKEFIPDYHVPADVLKTLPTQKAGGQYSDDPTLYHIFHVGEAESVDLKIPAGKYLVNDEGKIIYFVDPAINGKLDKWDDGRSVKSNKYSAPKTQLMAKIIDGIFNQKLPWSLVLLGVLIAVTLELTGVPSLPFAVGVYLPLESSTPIFLGGMVRLLVERVGKWRGKSVSESEAEMSPGSLMATGYIAGASIAGVLIAFVAASPAVSNALAVWQYRTATVSRELPVNEAYAEAARRELGLGEGDVPANRQEAFDELAGEFPDANESELPKFIRLPPDTKLVIPQGATVYDQLQGTSRKLDQDEEIPSPSEPTTLGEYARQVLGSEDKASAIYENNQDRLKLPETLPAGAVIKLPQRNLTAAIASGAMVLILLLVGLSMYMKRSPGPVAPHLPNHDDG
ncbi:MAG TPA: OPT/YSL family transporter, partial [Gemmataceae bacterium]